MEVRLSRRSKLFTAAGLLIAPCFLLLYKIHDLLTGRLSGWLGRHLAREKSGARRVLPVCTLSLLCCAVAIWLLHHGDLHPLIAAAVFVISLVWLDWSLTELSQAPPCVSELRARYCSLVRAVEPALRDRAQLPLLQHIFELSCISLLLLACFVVFAWAVVPAWLLLVPAMVIYLRCNGFWQEIVHIDSHMRFLSPRPSLRGRKVVLRCIQWYSDWVLSQVFGMFPHWYVTEHVGNHHPESNGPLDVETLYDIDRTSFMHFATVCGRITLNTTTGIGMYRYLLNKGKRRYARLAVTGAACHAATLIVAAWISAPLGIWFLITTLGFGFSLSVIAVSDHGLAEPDAPADVLTNSYNVLWTLDDHGQYGSKYHLTHHLHPAPTWGPRTEALVKLHNQTVCRERQSIVFHPFAYPDDLLRAFWRNDPDYLYPYVAAVGETVPSQLQWQRLFERRIRPASSADCTAWERKLSCAMASLLTSHVAPPMT